MTATAERPRARRPLRHGKPPAGGWWGKGRAPWLEWPGVTIELPARWNPARPLPVRDPDDAEERPRFGAWESPDGLYWFDIDAAAKACDFFPELLAHHKGEFANQPFALMPYQERLVLRPLFGWKRASDNLRRFRILFLAVPKGNGKALALDTSIPVPGGWRSMGDLRVGDAVFDERGVPTSVIAATPPLQARPCYRVTFDDGTEIVADAEHPWWTERRRPEQQGRPVGGLRSTREIHATLRYANGPYQSANHSVALAGPLGLAEAALPLEPYALGMWLGNGERGAARVTNGRADGAEVAHLVAAAGTPVGRLEAFDHGTRFRMGGDDMPFQAVLRREGLLGNKHVPAAYLRASRPQRLALLQGLMDSDGYIDVSRGACEFCSTTIALADGVQELAHSLGFKTSRVVDRARLNGRDMGPRYRVQFFVTPAGLPVFRLGRKLAGQRAVRDHGRRRLAGQRCIIACEPVPSVPVRCIQVAAASGQFLASRAMVPTHNSALGAGIGLYLTFCDDEDGAEVFSAAADREQAGVVFDNARIMVETSPLLEERAQVLRRVIYVPGTRSSYKVCSADAATKHGPAVHGLIFDEFHSQPNRTLYETLQRGTVKRRQPVTVLMTTAGDDDESICAEEWDYARSVQTRSIPDETYLPVIFEAKPDDEWRSPAIWRRVNPGFGVTVKADAIARECRAAQNEPRKLNDFLRFHLDRWVNQAMAWIPVDWWDRCRQPPEDDQVLRGYELGVGLDLSQKYDLTACLLAFRRPVVGPAESLEVLAENELRQVQPRALVLNFELVLVPYFWIPEDTMREREREDGVPYSQWHAQDFLRVTEGNVIDYDVIFRDITRTIATRFPRLKQAEIAYDPAFATQLALQLQGAGYRVVETPQNYKHLSEPAQVFEALVKGGRVQHGGHPVLRQHIENVAIRQDDAGRIRPVKPRRRKRIDGVVAALMGLGRLIANPPGAGGAWRPR